MKSEVVQPEVVKPESVSQILARVSIGKKKKVSLRVLQRAKRRNSKNKLKLLVESFECDETRRHAICKSLSISASRWKLYWMYKEDFKKGKSNYRSFDFVEDLIRRREFGILKSSLQGWVNSRKYISNETLFSEARKCMTLAKLQWLKHNWDPATHITWFNATLLRGSKRPTKKLRKLFEWVESTVKQAGSIDVKEVREKAAFLVDRKFAKYKKFAKLGDRIKSLLILKSEGSKGKQSRWVPK